MGSWFWEQKSVELVKLYLDLIRAQKLVKHALLSEMGWRPSPSTIQTLRLIFKYMSNFIPGQTRWHSVCPWKTQTIPLHFRGEKKIGELNNLHLLKKPIIENQEKSPESWLYWRKKEKNYQTF